MSKKKGNKKNQDFEEDLEEKKVSETHDITSKSKSKGKKKGKGNAGDWSDSDEEITKKTLAIDDEDVPKPAVKKSQKKGKNKKKGADASDDEEDDNKSVVSNNTTSTTTSKSTTKANKKKKGKGKKDEDWSDAGSEVELKEVSDDEIVKPVSKKKTKNKKKSIASESSEDDEQDDQKPVASNISSTTVKPANKSKNIKDMSQDKRIRSPNWLPAEKELLLSLVELYFNVIENKKLDGISIKTKLAQWQIIADKYNSRTSHYSRTADNLKAQWESMKKQARRDAANRRKYLLQTGGGSALPPKKMDPILHRILSLLTTSAVSLCNPYDSDSVDSLESSIGNQAVIHLEDVPEPPQKQNIDKVYVPSTSVITKEEPTRHSDVVNDTQEDWGEYTPQLLGTPASLRLKKDHRNQTSISRRHPSFSNITSSLELLHKKKIEEIDFNKKLAKEEMERTKILQEINIKIARQKLLQERLTTNILQIKRRKLLASIEKKIVSENNKK